MSSIFSQVPDDILLYISKYSGLLDNVSFSMVCKQTYSLSTHRSFWIYALGNESFVRPIACAPYEDLTKHDLQNLRRIALHTLRLQKNWASETPQILRPICTAALGLATVNGFYQIPATELYIFYFLHQSTVELWHSGWGKRVGTPIAVPMAVIDISAHQTVSGQYLVAFLGTHIRGKSEQYHVVVVCVEYGRDDIAMKSILRRDLAKGKHWSVILDDDLVGTLCCGDEIQNGQDLTLCVSALNLSTMKEVLIATDLPSSDVSRLMLPRVDITIAPTIEGDLYILIVDTPKSFAFTIPRNQLPHTDNLYFSEISTEILQIAVTSLDAYSEHARDLDSLTGIRIYALKANSRFGIPAMSVVTASAESQPCFLDVHFWVRSEDPKVPVTLHPLPKVIAGSLDFGPQDAGHPAALALSGRKGLLLYRVHDDDQKDQPIWVLRLMSYEPDAAEKVSFRNLVVPKSFDLSNIYTLYLDDHMGVVTLIDLNGSLYTISYA